MELLVPLVVKEIGQLAKGLILNVEKITCHLDFMIT